MPSVEAFELSKSFIRERISAIDSSY